MKTYLVTGGAGFIGSTFVLQNIKAGHRVVVLDALTYAGHKENLLEVSDSSLFEFVKGDICDANLVRSLFEKTAFDAVVNFAAESHVDRSISGPAAFIQTNILGTFNLLENSLSYWKSLSEEKKSSFRYLQVSTDEVYGELGETGKFSETTPYHPSSPYSSSKAGADHLVRAWNKTFGLPALITNCSNNYGPRQFPEKLIPLMIHHAVTSKPLPVYGKGANIRDWIHVEDHCRGIALVLEKGKIGETYCLGGNAERTNLVVVQKICEILNRLLPRSDGKSYDFLITYVTDRLGHDFRYAIDDSKAVKEVGFKREYTFESGLEATINWYLKNQKWIEAVLKNAKSK